MARSGAPERLALSDLKATRRSFSRILRAFYRGELEADRFKVLCTGFNSLASLFKAEMDADVERRLAELEAAVARGDYDAPSPFPSSPPAPPASSPPLDTANGEPRAEHFSSQSPEAGRHGVDEAPPVVSFGGSPAGRMAAQRCTAQRERKPAEAPCMTRFNSRVDKLRRSLRRDEPIPPAVTVVELGADRYRLAESGREITAAQLDAIPGIVILFPAESETPEICVEGVDRAESYGAEGA